MINIKHKKKQIEYRYWSSDNKLKHITKFEIVKYFTDNDDFFIDLVVITNYIIIELYFDYIKK